MPSDLQVSNIKANDGTAGLVIANSTGAVSFNVGHGTLLKVTTITATGVFTHTLQASTNFSIVHACGGGGQGGGSGSYDKAGTGGGAGASSEKRVWMDPEAVR